MNRNKGYINFFFAFARITGILPVLLFFKPRVKLANGAKRSLPKPAILVSNHCSLLDFVLYLLVFPFSTIRFLMAEVLFNKGKFMSWLLYSLGGIFVGRETKDFGFVSDSLEVLDNGGIIGVFPQGRLPIGDKPFPFTPSTAFIASKCDAPVIPIYTDGNYGVFKRATVVIGEPIYLADYRQDGLSEDEQLAHLTKVLEHKVFSLANEIKGKEVKVENEKSEAVQS